MDNRDAGENYWVLREKVDQWAKTKVANLLPRDEVPVSRLSELCVHTKELF
jgi:hypothetical protein